MNFRAFSSISSRCRRFDSKRDCCSSEREDVVNGGNFDFGCVDGVVVIVGVVMIVDAVDDNEVAGRCDADEKSRRERGGDGGELSVDWSDDEADAMIEEEEEEEEREEEDAKFNGDLEVTFAFFDELRDIRLGAGISLHPEG